MNSPGAGGDGLYEPLPDADGGVERVGSVGGGLADIGEDEDGSVVSEVTANSMGVINRQSSLI